jgi:general secretion pathway protein F
VLTRLLIGISHGLRDYWWLAFIAAGCGVYALRRWLSSERGARTWDLRKLGLPVFGSLLLMIAISRFTKTLSTLLRSGVPLLTALDITKNVLENRVLTEIVEEARVAVKEGANLAEPLKRSGRFPPIVTHMIAIGERSGALEEMLNVVSDAYESQVDNRISMLTSLLEPLMIVMLALVVGTIVMALFLPLIDVIKNLSGGAGG